MYCRPATVRPEENNAFDVIRGIPIKGVAFSTLASLANSVEKMTDPNSMAGGNWADVASRQRIAAKL